LVDVLFGADVPIFSKPSSCNTHVRIRNGFYNTKQHHQQSTWNQHNLKNKYTLTLCRWNFSNI